MSSEGGYTVAVSKVVMLDVKQTYRAPVDETHQPEDALVRAVENDVEKTDHPSFTGDFPETTS